MGEEQQKKPTDLELAEKAYQDALARRQQAQEQSIRSYQDIIDRMAPPETLEQQAERERKETNKRNLLGLIQLGANIGNLVNATTRGSHGGRSVATPDLVGAYDSKLKNDLTQRMARDDKRNAIRQHILGLNNSTANNDVKAANQRLMQAQKNELAYRQALQKKQLAEMQAEQRRSLEEFKAENTARENDKKIDWEREKQRRNIGQRNKEFDANSKYRSDMLEYRKAMLDRANKGNTKVVPVTTAENETYSIPTSTLTNTTFLGNIMQHLPGTYRDRITLNNENPALVIGDYLRNSNDHVGVVDGVDMSKNYQAVKDLLKIAQSGNDGTGTLMNFEQDMMGDDNDDDFFSITDD